MEIFQILGGIGALCFAFCLLPQVIRTYKEKDASGLSWAFLWLSFGGNVASCVYVVYTNYISGVWQFPLYFNYGVALVLCILLMVAKWRFLDLKKIDSIKISEAKFDPLFKRLEEVSGKLSTCKILYEETKKKNDALYSRNSELYIENLKMKAFIQRNGLYRNFEQTKGK